MNEQAFHVGLQHADERAVIGDSGDDGVEDFADPVLHSDRCQALRHFAFHFSGGIFLLRAVGRNGSQFVIGIWILLSREHGLDQPLRDNIGETAVGRGRVRVVLDREAEVTGRRFSCLFQHVLARDRSV